jgi:hypothetical protein
VFDDQGPALRGDKRTNAGALRRQPEAALALLGGRDPVQADREARRGLGGEPHQPAPPTR